MDDSISRLEHAESLRAIADMYNHVEKEVERLRALLRDIAATGVPLKADSNYVEALIDRATWTELQRSAFAAQC